MTQKILAQYPFIGLACVALMIFAGVFAGVVGRACFGRTAREIHKQAELLPLSDGE